MTSRLALPPVDSEEDLDDLTDEDLRPGVAALCRDLGVDPSEVVRFPDGTLPVYAVGSAVLKLFPPVHIDEFAVEAGVLAAVAGRLPVPTPGLRAAGERDDWGYVLMDRLRGEPLETAWHRLAPADRDGLATRLGEALAALHAVPVPTIDDWWPEDWDDFVYSQRATCVARHRGLGLAPEWLAQVEPFLDGVDLPEEEPVLLHTEILREHLLVAPGDGGWLLTGLLDFEPAIRGAREYEFVGLACSVAAGDARFLGRTLRAYGHLCDEAFRRRMAAWTLLHFYGNVRKSLDRLPQPEEPTFESLGERWYATEA